jgi:DNA polymerase gamma 1
MHYLIRRMKIDARFLISIHDEVRFMVKEQDQHKAALALQISNLLVRCVFAEKVGIYDLPLNVAFFSSVDIDHCLRKEVDVSCLTPSNDVPVEAGKSINIYDTVNYFKDENTKEIFGDELESIIKVQQMHPEILKIPELNSQSNSLETPIDWIKIQMAKSAGEVAKLFQKVKDRKFFLK